jgi:hypothetical protein
MRSIESLPTEPRTLSEAYRADAVAYRAIAKKAKRWHMQRFWEREADRAERTADRFAREGR